MAALGLASSTASALPGAVLCGLGWITVLTSLIVSAQTALPNWVRARGLAITMMVFFGCMAAGSAIWGQVATWTSTGRASRRGRVCGKVESTGGAGALEKQET